MIGKSLRGIVFDITQNLYHVGANMKETKEFSYYKNWVRLPYVGFGPSYMNGGKKIKLSYL